MRKGGKEERSWYKPSFLPSPTPVWGKVKFLTMAKMKKKARGLERFNVLSSRAPFLERPSMNIIKDRRVYVGETMYQDKTLRSREATFNKARDALYDKMNISIKADLWNIIMKKKKTTRGEASTAKSQERKEEI